jgi:S1-C subfamily serine protease
MHEESSFPDKQQSARKATVIGIFLGAGIALALYLVIQFTQARPLAVDYAEVEQERIVEIYKKTNEAVVFISTLTFFVDPYDYWSGIHPKTGAGSGVIVDAKQGIIITNFHVIQNVHELQIVLGDGSSHRAELLGHDAEYDIAVLRLRDVPPDLVAVELGDSARVQIGQQVLAIGNPHGLDRTLTMGVVSSVGRTVRNAGNFLMKDLIQTDAAINPGNSGGPLIDLHGRMIGMNTAILSNTGESVGIGFAVPSNELRQVLPELVATGKILRPKMGWLLIDSNRGPVVQRVFSGGPAEGAGVTPIDRPTESSYASGYVRDIANADMVIAINGTAVQSRQDVDRLISEAVRGEPIQVTLRNRGLERDRTLSIMPQLN